MKRGRNTKWTVDWTHEWDPPVGRIVKRITPTSQDGGYWRVTGVRPVKTRKPMPEGYTGRFIVYVEYVGERVSEPVAWTCYAWARERKLPPIVPADRFSPLLPPDESE